MSMFYRFLSCLTVLFALGLPAHAQEVEPAIQRIDLRVEAGRLLVDADVDFPLTSAVRDAAERGLPLYITADLVVGHSRWWWFDRTDLDTSITWRIVFNALTRQWRVGQGELSFPVSSLDDALNVVRNMRNWNLASTAEFKHDINYEGQMRVRLDNSLLPRPLQVNALNSSAWSISTPWTPFSFSIGPQTQVSP
ncbi:MAG: DUF4390 domain-containing protein [Comamonadaceae bacterium]|nr:MAG: DUF4390 domain-containing protein [Comamonadaceae bacterium]